MKIRVVSKREEIPSVDPKEIIVHLAFRPKNEDILNLVKACPKIEAIQVPASYIGSVSKSIKVFLDMERIQLIEGTVWGHRTDRCDSYTIPLSLTTRIKEMRSYGVVSKTIEEQIVQEFKIDAGMVEFIMASLPTTHHGSVKEEGSSCALDMRSSFK